MPNSPVIDGSDVGLKDDPWKMLEKGEAAKVPIIYGSNKDDGSMFLKLMPMIVPDDIFNAIGTFLFGLTDWGLDSALSWKNVSARFLRHRTTLWRRNCQCARIK